MENKDKLYTGIIITVLAMAFMFVILVTTLEYTSRQKNDLSFEIVSQEDSFGNEPVTLKKGENGYHLFSVLQKQRSFKKDHHCSRKRGNSLQAF